MLPKLEAGVWLSSKESARQTGGAGLIPRQEGPLEKEVETHSSLLAWRSPRAEKPGGYSPWGLNRVAEDIGAKQQQQRVTRPHMPKLKLSHAATKIQDPSCHS